MQRLTTESAGMTRTYIVLTPAEATRVSAELERNGIPHMLHHADRGFDSNLRFLHTLTTDQDRALTVIDVHLTPFS